MGEADVADVVQVHLLAFPGSFLTFLGHNFLHLFYSALVERQEIAFVACGNGVVLGFVAGSASPGALYRALLLRQMHRFALAAVMAVRRNPAIIVRLLRAVGRPKSGARPPGTATLMSLAVMPDAQGGGLGRRLVGAFVASAAASGAHRVDLTTDASGNDRVNTFYQRLGFRVSRMFVTPEGREMNEYLLDITSSFNVTGSNGPRTLPSAL
jgi:ribosomal protein S18 acetylase RimI-like enzyme